MKTSFSFSRLGGAYPTAITILAGLLVSMGCSRSEPAAPSDADFVAFNSKVRKARPASLEPVGVAPARAWVTPINLYQNKNGQWVQLFAYKADSHTANTTIYLLALDLNSGKVEQLGSIPGLQIPAGAIRWLNGKLYFTNQNTQKPGHLYSYSPDTQAIEDLGAVSENAGGAWKIAVCDDGTISIAGTDMTLALYDTASSTRTSYGKVGHGHNFIYYIWHDKDWIYVSLRGKVPWEAIAVNRKTHEQHLLMTAPVDAHLKLGSEISLMPKEGPVQHFKLEDGQAIAYDPAQEPLAPQSTAAVAKVTPPQVSVDEITGHVKWQNPVRPDEWKEADLPVAMAPARVAYAAKLTDGRIAVLAPAYLPMAIFDPADDVKPPTERKPTVLVPLGEVSVRSLLVDGNSVFISGYPSSIVMRYEADKPVISEGEGEAANHPGDNPRFLYQYSRDLEGAHIAAPLVRDDSGHAWLIGRRHRFWRGFGLAWFDLKTEERGIFDDGGQFDQNQISWMIPLDGGKRLALTTCVQANDQRPGKPGTSGKLFIIDTHDKKIVSSYEPLPGYDVLLGVAQTDPDHVVGVAYQTANVEKPVFYRFNLKTGQTEQIAPGGRHGEPSDSGIPGKGDDFQLGPDGNVWTCVEIGAETRTLIKINPADLSITPVCQLHGGNIRFLFEGDDLLLTGTIAPDGDARLHRLRGVVK
jgi:hypothetical protein